MSELSYQLRKEVKEFNTGFFKGDLNKIRELIKRGANVNDIDEYDRTALHIACYNEKHVPDLDLIETLIRCGGRVDVVNRYGENCLHLICQNHYKDELVELLLDCGADPNQKDFHGNTPLHVLVENPKQNVSFNTLKIFTKKGADVYSLNKLNKNIFVYLEPQMNEDLQFYARRCLVKLNRLKKLLGLQQQQIPEMSSYGSHNVNLQNVNLQNMPPPIQRDLPKGSDVNTPIPNITPPTNTFAAVPISNAPKSPNWNTGDTQQNISYPSDIKTSETKSSETKTSETRSSDTNVPITYSEQSITSGVSNLNINPSGTNQYQSGGWEAPNQPYTQQKPVIEENPK